MIIAVTVKSRVITNTDAFREYCMELFSGEMQVLHLLNKHDLTYIIAGYSDSDGWVNLSGTEITGIDDYSEMDKYRLDPVFNNMISFAGDFVSDDFSGAISARLIKLFSENKSMIMAAYRNGGGFIL